MSKLTLLAAALAAALLLAACSSGDRGDSTLSDQTAPTVAGATTIPRLTTPTAAGATTTTTAAVSVGQKVNANVATQSEVQAALAANGVENPSRWAVEVVLYRPYATNDPSFAKLRQNLAKYNPSAATVDKIVASLSL